MPAGFGYGAVGAAFNAVRGGLARGAAGVGRYGMTGASPGLIRSSMARGLGAMSRMSNAGLSATAGGIAGGIHGGFSEDGSVLGGAMKGAALGAGIYGAGFLGRQGVNAFSRVRARGGGFGQAVGRAFQRMGNQSASYIANTSRRAYGEIRGLAWRTGR